MLSAIKNILARVQQRLFASPGTLEPCEALGTTFPDLSYHIFFLLATSMKPSLTGNGVKPFSLPMAPFTIVEQLFRLQNVPP